MEEKNEEINTEKELASWKVEEVNKHDRSRRWYVIATSLALLILVFSFFTSNFLLAIITIIVALITILDSGKAPKMVIVSLTNLGIRVGNRYYDYEEFKDFSIIYKPKEDIKSLYLEFNNAFRPRISLPLGTQNPLSIREILLAYIDEDLERINPPSSETLAKILKL